MAIFFETYSILQTLFLYLHIRKAKAVYFHKRGFPRLRHNFLKKKIVRGLIYAFNPGISIESVPMEIVSRYNWTSNKESVNFTEQLSPGIKKSRPFRVIRRIAGDENVLKCYKAYLIDTLSSKILFWQIAVEMQNTGGTGVIVPDGVDYSYLRDKLGFTNKLKGRIPSVLYLINLIREFFYKLLFLGIFLILPIAFVISKLNRASLKNVKKASYDIAMPFIWGFHGDKSRREDSYLYNHRIKPGQILHIFNFWRYPREIENAHRQIMRERGIPYADIRDYKLTPRFLLLAAKTEFTMICGFIAGLFYIFDDSRYVLYSAFILRHILCAHLELENVDFRVEFIRIDYSPDHIIKTIICNQRGKKTVGIQHSSFPYVLPQLCYTHVNKYLVYGDMFVRSFSPFWDKINIVKTGRENIDWVVNIASDSDRLVKLRERFSLKYARKQYTAVMALPSGEEYNIKSQWVQVYDALLRLKTSNINLRLFLRFRDKDDPLRFWHIGRFADFPRMDDRFVIDEEFTTYELMALADLFIANNLSYSIYESLAVGAKVFTFDFNGLPGYIYSGYGKDFVLRTKDDLFRVFEGLGSNFRGFDCDWARLKTDSNFYYDGKNLERIQQAVWDTVEETVAV